MARFNSGTKYNHSLMNGGGNYNSSPYLIIILDSGLGSTSIDSVTADIKVADTGEGQDVISLVVNIDIGDAGIGTDDISVVAELDITDIGTGLDELSEFNNIIIIEDDGLAVEDVAVAGAFFVIDSNRILHPLGVLVTGDSRYDLLPATRDKTEEIPGVHGHIDFGTDLSARLLELEVVADDTCTKMGKAKLQRLFAMYLDPTKGDKTLIFSDDVEKTYNVKYSGQIQPTEHPTWFEFALPFKMSNPFIMGSFEKVHTGTGTMTNEGTFEAPLLIEIAGPVTNPSVTIGGSLLTYTGTVTNGQTLTIDTGKQTARIGSNNALGNYCNGITRVFPMLYPGDTNVVADNNVTITWRDRWI